MTVLRNISSKILTPLTSSGDLRNAELSPVFQYSFEYTVDNTELTKLTLVAGGTATQASAMAVASSSTTTGSVACIQSKRQASSKAGFGSLARFGTLFETSGVAATEQFAGIVDESGSSQAFKNGYAIGYNGTTFGFHRFQNDTITTVAQTDWDDPLDGTGASSITIDLTKLNTWCISFGNLSANLCVANPATGLFVIVHDIRYGNVNIVPPVFMPNFHLTIYVNNKATTTNLVVKTDSFSYFIGGKTEPNLVHQPQQSSGIRSKGGVTAEVAIFTLRNKSTYAGKANFIEINLENSYASSEAVSANNLSEIRLIANATLGGTPSYGDINTSDSVVEIDTAGTTVTGGKELLSAPLAGKDDRELQNIIPYKFIIPRGETVTVSGKSTNSATIKAALLWRELF